MIEAFNAQAIPLSGLWPGVATAVLLGGCALWRWSGRRLRWFVPAFIALFGVLAAAVPSWDQLRLRRMLQDGEGLTVTRGPIAQTWHIEERRRDWSKTSISYKTVISEGFDIGDQRFSWVIGSCLSPASLCDLSRSKVALAKGMPVEVTWFADPAQQDEPRILRLVVRKSPLPSVAAD